MRTSIKARPLAIMLCIIISIFFNNLLYASEPSSRVLVVCYSRDGHTKMVAEKLAEKFNADLEMLIDTTNRTGAFGTAGAGNDALMHKTTTIEPLQHNPEDYEVILIGTPGWFSNMTPAVRTFIKDNELSGKTIGYFATCHKVGADKATLQMAELIDKDTAESSPKLPLTHHDLEEGLDRKIDRFYEQVMAHTTLK